MRSWRWAAPEAAASAQTHTPHAAGHPTAQALRREQLEAPRTPTEPAKDVRADIQLRAKLLPFKAGRYQANQLQSRFCAILCRSRAATASAVMMIPKNRKSQPARWESGEWPCSSMGHELTMHNMYMTCHPHIHNLQQGAGEPWVDDKVARAGPRSSGQASCGNRKVDLSYLCLSACWWCMS